jgi:hypothetical protein
VYFTIKKMETSPFDFVVRMGKEMFNKWDKYWSGGNALLAIACILDPRCKMEVVEYYYKMIDPDGCVRFLANIKNCMKDLFKEYVQAHTTSQQNQRRARTRHVV